MARECLQTKFDPGTAKVKAQKATVQIEVTHGGGTCNVFEARKSINEEGFVSGNYNAQITADLSSICSDVCGGGTFGGEVNDTTVSVENELNFNATGIASGVIRVPVYVDSAGTYVVTLAAADKSNDVNVDANLYTEVITTPGGWTVVDFDLSAGPDSLLGGGSTLTALGANVEVSVAGVTVGDEVRIGDIEAFESREDIKRKDVITGTCVTAIEPSQSRSRNTDDCGDTEYDSSGKENTASFTIGKTTLNDYLMDVTAGKEVEVDGYTMATATVTVDPVAINGIDYGKVQFSDIYDNGCGFSSAYVDAGCGKVLLSQVNTRTPVALGDQEYLILDGNAEPTNLGVFLVNSSYVGSQITVTYLKKQTVRRTVTGDEIQDRSYRVFYKLERSDGVVREYELTNFAPTSYNLGGASSTEATFATVEGTYDTMVISRAV
jgi:hypothetical protein